MGDQPRQGLSRRSRLALLVLAGVLSWAAIAVPVSALVFVKSSRATTLASHDAVISPTFDGWASINLGPFLPSFRYPSGHKVGAEIVLGKTTLKSYDDLVDRYASLAAQPDSQVDKVKQQVREMAIGALIAGGLAGLTAPALWLLLGPRRRRELMRDMKTTTFTLSAVVVTGAVVVLVATHPWDQSVDELAGSSWQPIAAALPEVTVPTEARELEVDTGLLTQGTKRLVASALDSYQKSSTFYTDAATAATSLTDLLHQPGEDQTVAVLVSDRHDNIGMDQVARAIADLGGATVLFDAGDDTSTGSSWEAFSLESLAQAFDGFSEKFFVAGNHDHGNFITDQAGELGFTALDGEVVESQDGIRLIGVDDPRSSGLGNWKDESGLSFEEVAVRLADETCAADEAGERVTTLLVHDARSGAQALARGCTDLVLAGHLHVVVGPDQVVGENGEVGYQFTTGTTGGAAYAIAIGTKPRRDATVTLVTYEAGRPVGIQWVSLSPLGDYTVSAYSALTRQPDTLTPATAGAP